MNHLAFVLRLEHRGRDLYPDLRAFVEAGKVPDDDLVRADLFRRLGFYPTESSEHHAEYNPWFIGKGSAGDAVERFHVPIGEYLDRVSRTTSTSTPRPKRKLDAGEPFEIERSGEYAAMIADAMTTGEPARIVANAINGGALIPNLDGRRLRRGARRSSTASASTRSRWAPCRSTSRRTSAAPSTCRALTVRAALDQDRDRDLPRGDDGPDRPEPA